MNSRGSKGEEQARGRCCSPAKLGFFSFFLSLPFFSSPLGYLLSSLLGLLGFYIGGEAMRATG